MNESVTCQFTTVVSGLPRSGTSVMMQMLAAGGMALLTDEHRPADADNPRGYFEFEQVKAIRDEAAWLNAAAGKAVKMVHLLLPHLPSDRLYRVIFMRRNLDQVIASQRTMLQRQGRRGADLAGEQLKALFAQQVENVLRGVRERGEMKVLEVRYEELIAEPLAGARMVAGFLGQSLDERAMAAAVDPALYRNRC
jgi:hypothetical protein